MPPKLPNKSRNSTEQEGRVLPAISASKEEKIHNIAKTAHVYNVPIQHWRQLNGREFWAEGCANLHKLTKNEKDSIVQWVLSLEKRGAAPKPAHIQEIANVLLSKSEDADVKIVGIN